jgi:hypothetical protein
LNGSMEYDFFRLNVHILGTLMFLMNRLRMFLPQKIRTHTNAPGENLVCKVMLLLSPLLLLLLLFFCCCCFCCCCCWCYFRVCCFVCCCFVFVFIPILTD